MGEIRRFFARLFAFFNAGTAERELARELAAHLDVLESQEGGDAHGSKLVAADAAITPGA